MAGDDDGAALIGQVPHEIAQLDDALGVQPVLRLVKDEDLRVGQKRHGQGQAHLHTRGEGSGTLPADPGQTHTLQERVDRRRGGAGQAAVDEQVAPCGQLGEERGTVDGGPHMGQAAPAERSALDLHPAGVGLEQSQSDVEGGRLAGTVETEQPVDTAGIGRQVEVSEDPLATEGLRDPGEP